MLRLTLNHIEPTEALWLKDQLVRDGLVMNEDFEWEYHPAVYDNFSMEQARHVVFTFRDPAMATFYQLKWS